MRGSKAFTLVELLVVIGIIGVLMGILVPALGEARKQSRAVACKAQLQSIGQAMRMYLNENRDRYPPAPALPSVNPRKLPTFMDYFERYVGKDSRVFQCPADTALFLTEKTSFMYYAELGERPIRETMFFRVLGSVDRVPVLWDAGNFHGGAVPYNWLLGDGHVDQFVKQTPQ